jgi:hypothetical protein
MEVGLMRNILLAAGVCLAVTLLGAGNLRADTLSFQNGNTVTGSFVYDPSTNSVVSFNFTSTEFGGTTFIGAAPYTNTSTASARVVNNTDGDQVFSFDANETSTTGELNIVISCGGVANCATQGTAGNSFAIVAGLPACPTGATCIASGQFFSVPECVGSGCPDLLSSGNFITITAGTNGTLVYALSLASTGTVFNGSGGGGNNTVPEPSTVLLLGCAIGVVFLAKIFQTLFTRYSFLVRQKEFCA